MLNDLQILGGFLTLKKHQVLFFLLIVMVIGVSQSCTWASDGMDWQIMINIPEYKLYVYHGGNLLEKYPVAVGKPSEPSPVGDFYIVNKVVNPVWYPQGRKPVPPGPANPLGKYWLGLNIKGYGIHGNNSPNSIGNPVSKGCFRMRNDDIEKLFQLIPKGTPVKVKYAIVQGWVDAEERAWLEFFPDIYKRANLEQAVTEVLMNLQWKYQPHLQALGELMTQSGFSVVEVPRTLDVIGELTSTDGFLWDNEIYFSVKSFNLQEDLILGLNDQPYFKGYISGNALNVLLNGKYKWDFNGEENRVNLYRLKVLVNGREIEDLGRVFQNVPWIDAEKIGKVIRKNSHWNVDCTQVAIGDQRLTCIDMEGRSWISVKDIHKIGSTFEWDEKNWLLKLFFWEDSSG